MRRDIALVIPSRGREAYLTRLLDDLDQAFLPALADGGMSGCAYVYAQAYSAACLDGLRQRFAPAIAAGRLILHVAERPHRSIGEVMAAAIAGLNARQDYRLAMLMDDDSLYRAEPQVDANLRAAAQRFLANGDRAYSIKLGQTRTLQYLPFIDPDGPIMPFKEKMLWVSRAVMDEALAMPRFADLSVGEDAVLSALAWCGDAARCAGVLGIASFLHLGFEPDGEATGTTIAGGYGELMGYVEGVSPASELGKYEAAFVSGVTPYMIMPEIFVPPDHPHHTFNGILPEAVARHNRLDDRPGQGPATDR